MKMTKCDLCGEAGLDFTLPPAFGDEPYVGKIKNQFTGDELDLCLSCQDKLNKLIIVFINDTMRQVMK
jgi:hypothetical protein